MIDQWFYQRAEWKEKFALLPRRCDISNKWIWGWHYHGSRFITGPGDPVIISIWNDRNEHLIYRLKEMTK